MKRLDRFGVSILFFLALSKDLQKEIRDRFSFLKLNSSTSISLKPHPKTEDFILVYFNLAAGYEL